MACDFDVTGVHQPVLAHRRILQQAAAMSSHWPVAALSALSFVPTPAAAAPLQPTGQWNMQYTPTSCEAKRRFGAVAIAIVPGALGESTRVMLELPGKAVRARQYPAIVDPRDGRNVEKATALLFPLTKSGTRGVYTVLPNALVDRLMASGTMSLEVGNPKMKIAVKYANVSLALGSTKSLQKALDACMTDLRTQWGMVEGKLPKPAIASYAKGDVRSIFKSEDYPEEAADAGQSGTTRYLLMIARDGSVMDCVVAESSGVASLDAMGCQVIRERAKFKPAIDANGKPTIDTYGTPPIRWQLN